LCRHAYIPDAYIPEASKMLPTASVIFPNVNTTADTTSDESSMSLIPKYSTSSTNSSSIMGIIIIVCCSLGANVALMVSDIKSTPSPAVRKM